MDSETWDNESNVMKMTRVDSMALDYLEAMNDKTSLPFEDGDLMSSLDHLEAMNDKASVPFGDGDLMSKKSDKTYALSKPRPSEVPGTVAQRATKES